MSSIANENSTEREVVILKPSLEDLTAEVTLLTSLGDFTVELYYKDAPRACRNFLELSRQHLYDGVIFHKVIKNFIVQAGGLSGTRKGIKSFYGAKFEDEIRPELNHAEAGILSMANNGPNTNGTQFFITLAPCPSLDGKHTIFGRVCRGMETIIKLGNVQTDKNDRPVEDVKILGASVKDVNPCTNLEAFVRYSKHLGASVKKEKILEHLKEVNPCEDLEASVKDVNPCDDLGASVKDVNP